MIVVGIDEAGYGPLLGPLVVAGTKFRVPDGTPADAFGAHFRRAVKKAKLRVGDSKEIFGGTREIGALEEPLLAFIGACAASPKCIDEMLAAVGVDPASRLSAPWYSPEPDSFPVRVARDAILRHSIKLRSALAGEGIEFLGFAADIVPEQRLNAAFDSGNKADLLFSVASGIFDRLSMRPDGVREEISAVFDRHGGRHFYGAVLQQRWPDALTAALGESPTRSDYRVHFPGAPANLRFEVEADGRYPEVGLASMLAKYLRELFMSFFNRHFAGICPGVAPTAGYRGDGRRWLDESRVARMAAGIPDSALVRLR